MAVVVAGAGPLGAATAWHLARRGRRVTIASDAAATDAAYRSSGGSICWHRPDPRRAAIIRETAAYVRAAVAGGAAIRCREVPYVFLADGVQAPALNVASADLVDHLLAEAERAGARRLDVGRITGVGPSGAGQRVRGTRGAAVGEVVVLALGTGNRALLPGLAEGWEARRLFVLDLPVDAHRARWPHTIAPVGDGFAYVFIKELDGGLRVVVGHEGLIADDEPEPADAHFATLLDTGVADRFPFLRGAAVDQVLWGRDWSGKLPHITDDGAGRLSVNCGSAVRACVGAGRLAADATERALGALVR